jgi:hypothetical protein
MKWLALLLLLVPLPSFAAQPFAQVAVEASGVIVPGQQVRVIVDVFAPDFFTSPPQFPLFDVPDALVTLPGDRAQNMVQTLDGQQYSGIRRIYAVIPAKSGSFMVPAIRVRLGWSADGKPTMGDVVTNPVRFEVTDGSNVGFAAKGLEITQSFDRDPSSLKAGDALVRMIVVTATDTQGITMPAVDVGSATGLRQYVKPAKIEDDVRLGRGETTTRRTETIVYTADRQGAYAIPGVSYSWFDVDARKDAAAKLSEVAVSVAPAGARIGIAIEEEPTVDESISERRRVMLGILILLAFMALAWFGRFLPTLAMHLWSLLRQRRLNSRRHRLRCLKRTIRSAAPADVYAALHGWAHSEGYGTLKDWLADRPSPLAAEVASLERGLFGGGELVFDRKSLTSMLDQTSRVARLPKSALPPLNPV